MIRSALNLFSKHGIHSIRTIDVAKASGLSHGTVFLHFPKREDLIVTVIERFGKETVSRIHERSIRDQGLREVLSSHLQSIRENEKFYCALLREKALLPQAANDTLLGIQSAISFYIYKEVQKEIEKKRIRPVPMHLLFNTWIGLLHHYLGNRELFAPQESVIERYGDEWLDHIMNLLKYNSFEGETNE